MPSSKIPKTSKQNLAKTVPHPSATCPTTDRTLVITSSHS